MGHLAGIGHNRRLCNGQVDVGLVVVRTEATHSEIDGAFLVEFDEARVQLGSGTNMVKPPLLSSLPFAPRWCVAPLLILIYTSMLIGAFLIPVDPFEMVYVDW